MKNNVLDVLQDVLTDVLEKQAFMFAETADEDSFIEPEGDCFGVYISFNGKISGDIKLAVTVEMCREIAANIIGLDEDECSDEAAIDSLKEIANVACGNFLTEAEGVDEEFDITIPDAKKITQEEWDTLAASEDARLLNVDDYPLIVQLKMK